MVYFYFVFYFDIHFYAETYNNNKIDIYEDEVLMWSKIPEKILRFE